MPSVKIPDDFYARLLSLRSRYGTGHSIVAVLREMDRRLHENGVSVLTAADDLKQIKEDTAAIRQLVEDMLPTQTPKKFTVE